MKPLYIYPNNMSSGEQPNSLPLCIEVQPNGYKIRSKVFLNVPGIKMFQIAELTNMKKDQERNNLTVMQPKRSVSVLFSVVIFHDMPGHGFVKFIAEFMHNIEISVILPLLSIGRIMV